MDYFISDLHLFHTNAIKFDNRPFIDLDDMHNTIISNWNNTIHNDDTVYILGDISMRGTNEDLIKLVSILKGRKVLIKGNHDQIKDYRYERLFQEILDYKVIQTSLPNINDPKKKDGIQVVLSHYPIMMWNNQHRGWIHLYGHVHNSVEEILFQNAIDMVNNNDISKRRPGDKEIHAYNVGCMMPWINYVPRTLEEIIKGYELGKSQNYRGE